MTDEVFHPNGVEKEKSMDYESGSVLTLSDNDSGEVVDVLCESFFDYPVMRFVLGTDEGDYSARLKTLINFFVMARIFRAEFLLGVGDRTDLHGAALVSRPMKKVNSPELEKLRERVWSELGSSARARYESFGDACAQFEVKVPHIHLNMIGVRRSEMGKGLGRRLIEYVHILSANDTGSEGVTLNTEDARNVPLYEHLGYRLVGHATVAPGLQTWVFFRPD
jgi:GNAT superfamily N-acetyltransferase